MSHLSQNSASQPSLPCPTNPLQTYTRLLVNLMNQECDEAYQLGLAHRNTNEEIEVEAQSKGEEGVEADLDALHSRLRALEHDRHEAREAEATAKREVELLKGEVEKSLVGMQSLESFATGLMSEKSKLESELQSLKENSRMEKMHLLEEMDTARVDFSGRLEIAIREGADHEAKFKKMSEAFQELDSTVQPLVKHIERLKRESKSTITALQSQVDAASASHREVAHLQEQLSALTTKHARSSRNTEAALADSTRQVEQYAQELREVSSRAENERRMVEMERDTAIRELEEEKQHVSRIKTMAISLDFMCRNLDDARTTAAEQVDALCCQLSAAQKEGNREKEENETLEKRLLSLDAVVRRMDDARSAAVRKFNDISHQLSAVQQERDRAKKDYEKQISKLEAECAGAGQHLDAFRCQLSATQKELEQTKENFAQRISALDTVLRHHDIALVEHESYALKPSLKLVTLWENLHKLTAKRPTSSDPLPTTSIIPEKFTVDTTAVIPTLSARVDDLARYISAYKVRNKHLKESVNTKDQTIANLRALLGKSPGPSTGSSLVSSPIVTPSDVSEAENESKSTTSSSESDQGQKPTSPSALKSFKRTPSSSSIPLSFTKKKRTAPTAPVPSNASSSSVIATAVAISDNIAAISPPTASSHPGTKPSTSSTSSESASSKLSSDLVQQASSTSTPLAANELISLPSLKRSQGHASDERKMKRTKTSETEVPTRTSLGSSPTTSSSDFNGVPRKRSLETSKHDVYIPFKRHKTSSMGVPVRLVGSSFNSRDTADSITPSRETPRSMIGPKPTKVQLPSRPITAPLLVPKSSAVKTTDPRLSPTDSQTVHPSPLQSLPSSSPVISTQASSIKTFTPASQSTQYPYSSGTVQSSFSTNSKLPPRTHAVPTLSNAHVVSGPPQQSLPSSGSMTFPQTISPAVPPTILTKPNAMPLPTLSPKASSTTGSNVVPVAASSVQDLQAPTLMLPEVKQAPANGRGVSTGRGLPVRPSSQVFSSFKPNMGNGTSLLAGPSTSRHSRPSGLPIKSVAAPTRGLPSLPSKPLSTNGSTMAPVTAISNAKSPLLAEPVSFPKQPTFNRSATTPAIPTGYSQPSYYTTFKLERLPPPIGHHNSREKERDVAYRSRYRAGDTAPSTHLSDRGPRSRDGSVPTFPDMTLGYPPSPPYAPASPAYPRSMSPPYHRQRGRGGGRGRGRGH